MKTLTPKRLNTLFGALLVFMTTVYAQDWPQYLGPESGPEVLWTVEAGLGNGGPIVKDGRVYFLDRNDSIGDMMHQGRSDSLVPAVSRPLTAILFIPAVTTAISIA